MSLESASETGDGNRDAANVTDLQARIELLEEENRRLREDYARAKRARYRRTALGLVLLGLIGIGGALLFPDARTVLVSLGATGLFAGLLVYYLTPERFVSATIGEAVYETYATLGDGITAELGLTDDRVYVPMAGSTPTASLFIPQAVDYTIPDTESLGPLFIVGENEDTRGVSLTPTGVTLFREFERARTGPLDEEPFLLVEQLVDAIVEDFELATAATPDGVEDRSRLTVGITGSALGTIRRFDHPIPSFLASGLAIGLDRPIHLDVTDGDDRHDALVTVRWDAGDTE